MNGVDKVIRDYNNRGKLHFTNVSSPNALNKIRLAKRKFHSVTCETCAPYLYFVSDGIKDGDTRFKDSPPIRNAAIQELLWECMKFGTVDSISSRHHYTPDEFKFYIEGDFQRAVNGLNTLGFTL